MSQPGRPRHLQVPQQMGAYEIGSSAGGSQAIECQGGHSHRTEVMAREGTQAKALPHSLLGCQSQGHDTHPQRLG